MVMSNWSAPPRARISSTVRAPAMPLPMTTSFVFLAIVQISIEADVDEHRAADAFRRAHGELELALRVDVLHDRELHVDGALRADREVAHRALFLLSTR